MIDMMEQKTILIVDDENMMREAVASYLEKQGYHVLQAETGTQALSLLEKETVSFVILDLMLPDISGEEICSRIRRQSRIPIIMLTAKTMEDDMLNGLNLGADDYITKPFNAKILITRCNNLIRNRLLMQSRFAKDQILEINLLAANPIDKGFLDRVIKVVDKHIDNEDFDIGVLCQELGMGRTLLHTKFKALTGMTPNEFILNHRLKKASLMLRNEPYLQVAEISDRLGFGSPRYFSRCFKNQYNVTPMEYRKGAKQENLK